MMQMSFILILASICGLSFADWRTGPSVNTAFGVTAGPSKNEVFVAGMVNSSTPFIFYSNNRGNSGTGANTADYATQRPLAVGLTRDGSSVCVAGFSPADSACYIMPYFTKIGVLDYGRYQSVEPYMQSGIAITGTFFESVGNIKKNGIAVSADGGRNFQYFDIGLDASNGYKARYASLPTDDTWYVTSGDFPGSANERIDKAVKMSYRIRIGLPGRGNSKPQVDFYSQHNLRGGYNGAISKTTDGGKTWTKVYDSNKQFYFNQISCYDANTCFATAENGKMAVVLRTTDGGATWSNVLELNGHFSLHAVDMVSEKEIFVSGGTVSAGQPKELVGLFYRSIDGGKTWSKTSFNGYGLDMSFKDGVGYAVALFREHSDLFVWV